MTPLPKRWTIFFVLSSFWVFYQRRESYLNTTRNKWSA